MGTDQLLDLFQVSDKDQISRDQAAAADGGEKLSMREAIEQIGDLWDEREYEEFNIESFMTSMRATTVDAAKLE